MLTPWLQNTIDSCDKETNGWLALHQVKEGSSGGISCVVNDGSHKMAAFISMEAWSEFEKKRNVASLGSQGCRIFCKEYDIRSIQEDCFEPYLYISSFDSLGEYGSTRIFDHLQHVIPSKSWKLKCCEVAFQKFDVAIDGEDVYEQGDGNDDVGSTATGIEDSVEKIDWSESPMLSLHQDGAQEALSYHCGTDTATSQQTWGESPIYRLEETNSVTEMGSEEDITAVNVENISDARNANIINMADPTACSTQADTQAESRGHSQADSQVDPQADSQVDPQADSQVDPQVDCQAGHVQENKFADGRRSPKRTSEYPMNVDFSSLPECSKWVKDDTKILEVNEYSPHISVTPRLIGGRNMNLPGCKHNMTKTCYICLLRTRTTVPKSLYIAAKRMNFKCNCEKR